MRLIDADELIKHACRSTEWSHGEHPMVVEVDDIDDAPTVDAEPVKHAHWIPDESETGEGSNTYKCSACGEVQMLLIGGSEIRMNDMPGVQRRKDG